MNDQELWEQAIDEVDALVLHCDTMKKSILLILMALQGCSHVRSHEPSIKYESGFDVQYIAQDGDSCATVQCDGEGDLCLVTIEPSGPQKHVLGRTNSMTFAEKYCSPERTVVLP